MFLKEPEDRGKLAENYRSQETPGRRRAQVPVWALAKAWRPGAAKDTTWSQTASCSGVPQVLIVHCSTLLPLRQFLACSSESSQAPPGLVLNGHDGVCLTTKIVPAYALASAQNRWQSRCSAYTGRCLEIRNIQNLKSKMFGAV